MIKELVTTDSGVQETCFQLGPNNLFSVVLLIAVRFRMTSWCWAVPYVVVVVGAETTATLDEMIRSCSMLEEEEVAHPPIRLFYRP